MIARMHAMIIIATNSNMLLFIEFLRESWTMLSQIDCNIEAKLNQDKKRVVQLL